MHKTRYLAEKEEKRVELVRNISETTYDSFRKQQDQATNSLTKQVISFVWAAGDFISLFLIETFKIRGKLVSLANISTDNHDSNGKYTVPQFLEVEEDVTGKLMRELQLLDL